MLSNELFSGSAFVSKFSRTPIEGQNTVSLENSHQIRTHGDYCLIVGPFGFIFTLENNHSVYKTLA